MPIERLETPRLILQRPRREDAAMIFSRYAADAEVTRYLSWRRHHSIEDTEVFVGFSDSEWQRWGCGPYLAFSRDDGSLVGSTGLAFETPQIASTGYVFARDVWGRGYATESLVAMIDVARDLGVQRLYAICHVDHRASARVMEKAGLAPEGVLRRHTVFPNISAAPCDVLSYAITL